jgi:hypothetical protein
MIIMVQDDGMPYSELITAHWGNRCATPERASLWAAEFIDVVRMVWSPNRAPGAYFFFQANKVVC